MERPLLSLVFIILFSTTSWAGRPPLFNSHLRIWNAVLVEAHLKLGANIVEIDISDLNQPEIQKSLDLLGNHPGKIIALHLKGIGVDQLPQIEAVLEKNQKFFSQIWFFSGDGALDSEIRERYSLAYISRSTKNDVLSCLRFGLTDENIFRQSCIEKDLWVRPTMMKDQNERNLMRQLLQKIRDYEKSHPVDRSLVALDQIDSLLIYCDFIPDFSELIDGVVSEDFEKIAPIVQGKYKCPSVPRTSFESGL
jgi:hypothetical protein